MTTPTTDFEPQLHGVDPAKADRNKVLVYLFLLALLVRLFHVIAVGYAPFSEYLIGDAAKYSQWAENIAAGNWFGDTVFYQAPLYPYFLALIKVTLGDSAGAVRIVQMLIGALSCSILAAATWNLFGRRSAIVAGVVMSLYAPSIFLESLIQKTALDLFFICLILWYTSRILQQSAGKLWLMLGVSIGAFCLTRENAIALVPIFLAWSIVRTLRIKHVVSEQSPAFKKRLRHALLYTAGVCLILAPVALRNYAIGGELHVTTSQLGPNFYIGNNPKADGYYRPLKFGRGDAKHEQNDAIAIAEAAMNRKLSPGEVSDYYMRESFSFISSQPFEWAKLLGTKALLACNTTEIIDTEDQYVVSRYSPVLFVAGILFQFGFLFPIALIGMWQQRKRWRNLWPIYAVSLMFASTLIVFFIFGRYRYPLAPIFVLFAAPTIAGAISEFVNKPSKCETLTLANVVIALSLVAVCFLPIIETQTAASTTYNNYANQAVLRGDHDIAEDFVKRSLDANPNFALALNTKGVIHREQGNRTAAEESFRMAIRVAPNYENAKRNLAKLLSAKQ